MMRPSSFPGSWFGAAASLLVPLAALAFEAGPAHALTALEVNEAAFRPGIRKDGVDPATLRAQVLLDRLRFSPGSIDGRHGENFGRALGAFATANGLPGGDGLTPEIWTALVATYDGPVIVPYTIAAPDVKGPFIEKIPKDFEDMAELDALSYTSPAEGLAEKFHVSRPLLEALNPKSRFDEAGAVIVVAAVRPDLKPLPPAAQRAAPDKAAPLAAQAGQPSVARIEIDKTGRALRAYDLGGKLVGYYPATIGSVDKPAPTGATEIRAIARNPTYTYNPDYAFKGVKTKKKLEIAAGPNNPVGAVWLDLAIESYGIHGTPEPERVGKTFSHGCVRLTNWDVKDLASMVSKGTVVEFKE